MKRNTHLSTSFMVYAVLGLALCLPAPARCADRTLSVTGFYAYPDGKTQQSNASVFSWPDNKSLSVMVQVKLGGFSGKEKLDLFLVLYDDKDQIVKKSKGRHTLPAGAHDIAFSDFLNIGARFGAQDYRLELEVSLKGAAPVRESLTFSLSGPDAPHVDIVDLNMYNPKWGQGGNIYAPGEQFQFEATVEIEHNDSSVTPRVVVYGVMEEDSYDIDPQYESQPYTNQWDAAALPARDGVFRIVAHGRLPYFFAQPWDNRHAFRVYAIVDFGLGARTLDYERAELSDPDPGDKRQTDDITARLIELDRSYLWEVRRLRGGTPDVHDTWKR
jgi:hypothetical protein